MNNPKYFRLLEKGEKLKEGDLYGHQGNLSEPWIPGHAYDHINNGSGLYIRPVAVDEWIEYAKQKPTKEDFEPTGKIDCNAYGNLVHEVTDLEGHQGCSHWRRITPPQQPKPKSVILTLRDKDGHATISGLEIFDDGSARARCGDVISAESIDQFIKAREEVMDKKKGLSF